MKRLTFTRENRDKTRAGIKTQTRRLGRPQHKVGDVLVLAEPTQVLNLSTEYPAIAKVRYLDDDAIAETQISDESLERLVNRKDWTKPAIARFMLGDFARHYVRILAVREEWLQDISAVDAQAEGIQVFSGDELIEPTKSKFDAEVYRDSFAQLWNSIHAEPDRRWTANPMVTAYTYEFLKEGDRNG